MSSSTVGIPSRLGAQAAQIERVAGAVGLGHEDAEHLLRAERARGEGRADARVDSAGERDDGAALAQLPTTVSLAVDDLADDRSGVDRERLERDLRVSCRHRPDRRRRLASTTRSARSARSSRGSRAGPPRPRSGSRTRLEELDQLQHAGRVDHPGLDQRVAPGELEPSVAEREVLGEEVADVVFDRRGSGPCVLVRGLAASESTCRYRRQSQQASQPPRTILRRRSLLLSSRTTRVRSRGDLLAPGRAMPRRLPARHGGRAPPPRPRRRPASTSTGASGCRTPASRSSTSPAATSRSPNE